MRYRKVYTIKGRAAESHYYGSSRTIYLKGLFRGLFMEAPLRLYWQMQISCAWAMYLQFGQLNEIFNVHPGTLMDSEHFFCKLEFQTFEYFNHWRSVPTRHLPTFEFIKWERRILLKIALSILPHKEQGHLQFLTAVQLSNVFMSLAIL